MKCTRCGCTFELPDPNDTNTNVCGNCADDLRQEEDAIWSGDEAFWPNKEAYEEAYAKGESDYRFI